MTWVAWRLQRTETYVAAGILVLLAALLIPTGISMANQYHQDGLALCVNRTVGPTCSDKINTFESHFQAIKVIANWFTLIPGLIGVLLAAPFVIELEHGTYRLAWTQSITRRRWVVTKLGLAVAATVAVSVLMIALMTWWRQPLVHLDGRLDSGTFDTTGSVAVGYAVFALGLAVGLGALWRRSAVALTVAFVGYFVARIVDEYWLRQRLISPLHGTWHAAQLPHALDSANVLSINMTVNGRPVASFADSGGVLGSQAGLPTQSGAAHVLLHATYQPASFFWTMQLRETALFTAVGLAGLIFAAVWTARRAT